VGDIDFQVICAAENSNKFQRITYSKGRRDVKHHFIHLSRHPPVHPSRHGLFTPTENG